MDVLGLFEVSGWLVFITTLLGTTYWYYSTRKYWFEKAGVPGLRPWPVLGGIPLLLQSIESQDMELMKKHGKIVGTQVFGQPLLFVGDPDLIKQICVKDAYKFTFKLKFIYKHEDLLNKMLSLMEGEQWKMTRNILTPTFSTLKIKKMLPIITACSKQLVANITQNAKRDEKFEGKMIFGKFAMEVVAKSMFGLDLDMEKETEFEKKFVKYGQKIFDFNMLSPAFWVACLYPRFTPLLKKLGFHVIDPKMTDFYINTVKEVIKVRKESKQEYNDFLQLMLNAHTDEEFIKSVRSDGGSLNKTVKGLTEMEILAQSMGFLAAGYETTASLLSWTSYCLAANPEVQDMLREEIMDKIGDKKDLAYEDVVDLPYLDKVINETLRMHPPLLRFDRVSSEEYELAGYKIPAGVDIQVPVYFMHHNEEWWDEPMKFKPERFDPEERKNRNPYIFLPFGAGARNCIGMRFALIEAKVALVAILCKYKLALASGMSANINPLSPDCKMKKTAFHYPADGIWLKCQVQHIVE